MWSRGELYPGVGYVVGLSCISVLRVGLWAGATGSRLPWLHGLLFFWERSSLDKVHFPPRSLFLRDTVTVLVLSITFLVVLLFFVNMWECQIFVFSSSSNSFYSTIHTKNSELTCVSFNIRKTL